LRIPIEGNVRPRYLTLRTIIAITGGVKISPLVYSTSIEVYGKTASKNLFKFEIEMEGKVAVLFSKKIEVVGSLYLCKTFKLKNETKVTTEFIYEKSINITGNIAELSFYKKSFPIVQKEDIYAKIKRMREYR